uniref:Suppressor of cytokine signaling 1a n=1 Tax=Scleropages formosus TaxID=113540 RepID=A0A8C9RWC4_SCLFO
MGAEAQLIGAQIRVRPAGLRCSAVTHLEGWNRIHTCTRASKTHNRTHFRPFKSEKEFKMIAETTTMLENSGFYWGTMTAKQAEVTLHGQPVGTFLIRDSSQKDVFFTLSYVSGTGSLNIRITFKASRFSLCGSKEEFDSLFKLLEYYTDSPKKLLTKPLRRVRLQSLQELCRKRIIETYGGDEIDSIPLNPVLKDFLNSFPYRL